MNDESTPNYKKAEAKALEILREFAFTKPPVDPIEIAKGLGIEVRFVKLPPEYTNVSGYFDVKKNIINVNSEESTQRQLFTVAHELGHKILHSDAWIESSGEVLFRGSYASLDPKEREANAFAANLLLPKFMMDEFRKYGSSLEEWAVVFCVSQEFLKNRIRFLYGE